MTLQIGAVRPGRDAGGRTPAGRLARWLAAVVRTSQPRQWPKNLLVCAPGTAYGRAPRATGCRGDTGEERSRTQLPGCGAVLRMAAADGPE